MILDMFLLLIISIEPFASIRFDKTYKTMETYGNKIYLAQFIGKSIYAVDDSKKIGTITFTDDPNYRIEDFSVTPFAIYLNNGTTLEKYYIALGIKEEIFRADDISSFTITSSEEVILSDRHEHELTFLDFTHNVRLAISDINAKDLYYTGDVLYVLTMNELHLYDEHGNFIEKMAIPEKCTNIAVKDSIIITYSASEKYLYSRNEVWTKIKLSHGIRDIALTNDALVILDEHGHTLFFYDIFHIY